MRPYILVLALVAQTSKGTETLEATPMGGSVMGGVMDGLLLNLDDFEATPILRNPQIHVYIYTKYVYIYIGKCTDVLLHDM